jgi:hypothetical protein
MGQAVEVATVSDAADELRARRLVLVDDMGRVRATLGPTTDGSAALRLLDADERTRAELAIDANGTTTLTLRDGGGEFRSSLVVGPEGETHLHLHGAPAVSLHDDAGTARAVLGLDEHTGLPSLAFADEESRPCVLLTEDPSGGRLHLFQRDGEGRRIPACDPGDPDAAGGPLAPQRAEASPPAHEGHAGRRLATAVLVFVATVAGTLTGRLAPLPRLDGTPGAPAVVRTGPVLQAEELLLADRSGTTRARLSVLSDGTPLLWMTDPSGKHTIELGVLTDTGAVLRLNGGESSIALVSPPHDPPSVSATLGDDVVFQAPSNVARLLPPDIWP